MKRLFKIEDFDARFVDRHRVELYPFKRERFFSVQIEMPRYEVRLRTGKMGFEPGRIWTGSSKFYHATTKRTVRFGRAIIAAAGYLQEARMEVRKVPK